MLSVHVEVLPHLHRTISAIKERGVKAGVVLNPSTPVVAIEEVAGDVDIVLVMSVNPGFGGQTFIPRSVRKDSRGACAAAIRGQQRADRSGWWNRSPYGRLVVDAGAELLVAGQAIFGGGQPEQAARALKAAAMAARPRARGPRCQLPCQLRTVPVGFRRQSVRVRYAETDKMGVVYYAHYLVWFEIGRTEWLRETGWTYRSMEDEGLGAAGHRSALRIQGERALTTMTSRFGHGHGSCRRFGLAFDYEVVRRTDSQLIASGYTVHVTLDRSGRPVRLPARVRELLA